MEDVKLPDYMTLAKNRLMQLEENLDRDTERARAYESTMDVYISKGYARKLSDAEAASKTDKTWYLPHHAVSNPNKTDKIRVVFDAAASYKSTSLNDQLVSGSNLLLEIQTPRSGHHRRYSGHVPSGSGHSTGPDRPEILIWRGPNRNRPPEVYQM